jgi:hypothetical protein
MPLNSAPKRQALKFNKQNMFDNSSSATVMQREAARRQPGLQKENTCKEMKFHHQLFKQAQQEGQV